MIKDFFKEKNITQLELQKLTGIDQAAISRIFNYKQMPTLKQALLFEQHLNIPVSSWITDSEQIQSNCD